MEQRRKRERVEFQKGFDVNIMGIDGTWRRTCILKDVSVSGARLIMQSSIQGLILKEFFLAAFLEWVGLPPLRARLG